MLISGLRGNVSSSLDATRGDNMVAFTRNTPVAVFVRDQHKQTMGASETMKRSHQSNVTFLDAKPRNES